ncbi:MAG TPA: TetR/AcrR family transcriptional regulator [Candidatus Baltobacteraceae bacterium]|nr:TetR/AcrR family transcriptional regulator [Candidatus Baltobacteraceae bacterium]
MSRTVDLERRGALLERVANYVLKHGLAELSLRPLADAVDTSPRMLLYHFGSKEEMVTAVLREIRERQLALFDRLRRDNLTSPAAVCKAVWTYMSDRRSASMLKLFFETYALALRNPQAFPGFLEGAVEDWLCFLAEPLCSEGATPKRARTIATIILATYRGFMLDLAATGDRARIGRALDVWAESMHPLHSNGDGTDAESA